MAIKLATRIQGPVAVIGDVHGKVEELQAILDQLVNTPNFEHRWIVFIGDLVDRGPDPKGAVDICLQLLRNHPKTTVICGNHEFAMCGAMGWIAAPEETHWRERWVEHYDADTTFASYGAELGDFEQLTKAIPDRHRQLLSDLPWAVWHPQYAFVHAGLNPTIPFEVQRQILDQRDFSLHRPQWLCDKELVNSDPPGDCPVAVVSGHVRVPSVQIRPKRILIDTTGGMDGDLSCVLLPEKRIITSAGPGAGMNVAAGSDKSWWKFW